MADDAFINGSVIGGELVPSGPGAGYDGHRDVLLDALGALCLVELNGACEGAFGPAPPWQAVREVRKYPVPLDLTASLHLPTMAIFIERDLGTPTGRHFDSRLTVAFQYIAAATTLAKLGSRWPALRKVWSELVKAVRAGAAGGFSDGLARAGVMFSYEQVADVRFDHATDGERTFPQFIGRIDFLWRDPTPGPELTDLVELLADINRVDGNVAIQPQVQVKTTA